MWFKRRTKLFLTYFVFAVGSFHAAPAQDASGSDNIGTGRVGFMRATLSGEAITDYIRRNRKAVSFDIFEPISINVRANSEDLTSREENLWNVAFLRFASEIGSYADVNVNVDFVPFSPLTSSSPFDPISTIHAQTARQTINLFVARDIIIKIKAGDIKIEDKPAVNSVYDIKFCYLEKNKQDKVINIFANLDEDPIACLYKMYLDQIGLEGIFTIDGANATIPGFRMNAEMIAAFSIAACKDQLAHDTEFFKCIKGVVDDGK